MARNNIEVKKLNRNSIFTFLLGKEVVSKHDIAEKLKLSIPTVAQGLKELEELGLVSEEGALDSTGGRKARGYSGKGLARVALGVDITENHISMVILDLKGNVVSVKRKRMKVYDAESSYLELSEEIWALIKANKIETSTILGMGISLPAIIDENGQKINALYERMTISRDFYGIMSQYFSFPIKLVNDANSGGKAELRCRKDSENIIYLSLSHTLGGALLIRGQLFSGNSQRGGEIGHMTLIPGGRQCYCGRQGCLDAYCATKILEDAAEGDLEHFFENVSKKDELAMNIWNEYLDYLSIAIHNIHMVFDIDIVIGGNLGIYINDYLDELKSRVKKIDTYIDDVSFLKVSKLKYEAPAIGASSYFIESFINRV
jgi:predicted NBD/HSP70 family sugar kinase